MGLMDIFYDNYAAFRNFLAGQNVDFAAKNQQMRLRSRNRIHTKVDHTVHISPLFLTSQSQRFGIKMDEQNLNVPELSKKDFYDLCGYYCTLSVSSVLILFQVCIGAAEATTRFLEFESIWEMVTENRNVLVLLSSEFSFT